MLAQGNNFVEIKSSDKNTQNLQIEEDLENPVTITKKYRKFSERDKNILSVTKVDASKHRNDKSK